MTRQGAQIGRHQFVRYCCVVFSVYCFYEGKHGDIVACLGEIDARFFKKS